jgi:hypothetical protein
MHVKTTHDAPMQPLPAHVQERVWEFVRRQIHAHESKADARVAKFEIHVTDAGQIEVEVLGMQDEKTAALDAGLEGE